jgi:dienelactone hydrolase
MASAPFTRHEVSFVSGEATCSAWLYLPDGVARPPVVILGHGLGGTREMRLDAFAERFAAAGIAALAFTYRYFGTSGGQPRQLLSIKRQLADWDAAIAHVGTRSDVDGSRIAVWGSSFGGGHAILVASRHPELAAAIAQCPFTDGLAAARALGPRGTLKVLPLVARDLLALAFGREPVRIPVGRPPWLHGADDRPRRAARLPRARAGGWHVHQRGGRRVAPTITSHRPGHAAKDVASPILFCIVSLFRLLGGGVMGDMGKPLPASRLAILPATSHTAIVTQVNLAVPIIDQFLRGETPRSIFGGN